MAANMWINNMENRDSFKVKIHYFRYNRDFAGWNLWIWNEQHDGIRVDFCDEDEFGKVAIFHIDSCQYENKMGFIIRKSESFNEWAEKDIEEDRYFYLKGSYSNKEVDLYIIQDHPDIISDKSDLMHCYINFYYYRYESDYEDWQIWLWRGNKNNYPHKFYFNEWDSYGKKVSVKVYYSKNSKRIGFALRQCRYNNKQIINAIETDIVSYRYVNLSKYNEQTINIYLLQGEVKIGFSKNDIDKSPKILKARILNTQHLNTVTVNLSQPIYVDILNPNSIKLFDQEKSIPISDKFEFEYTNQNMTDKITILTLEPLKPFDKNYIISISGFKGAQLSIDDFMDTKEFEERFFYDKDDLGVTYDEQKTIFKVWAPTAISVEVLLYKDGTVGVPMDILPMMQDVCGIWVAVKEGNIEGVFYTYSVFVDGKLNEAVDPYAKAVGINGTRAMVINLDKTNPKGWKKTQPPILRNIEDSIIYELHVRDISIHKNSGIKNKGMFLGLTEKKSKTKNNEKTGLDHLIELGVTHAHLMPIFDFNSVDESDVDRNDYNWGYDPQNYNIQEGSYSSNPSAGGLRIVEFKKLIKAFNENGIHVVMDVVYNHTAATENSNFNLIVPNYYYRFDKNRNFTNGSGCGNEIASERPMVRKFIIDSLKYWVREYHVDGFRFDLMGLHDIDTMNKISSELRSINENILIYGEGWTADWSPLPYQDRSLKENVRYLNSIAVFNDDARDAIKGSNFHDTEPGFVNGAYGKEEQIKAIVVGAIRHSQVNSKLTKDTLPSKMVNYFSSHDNLNIWDKLSYTNNHDSEADRIKMVKLSFAIILTSQGIPFICSGDEFLRTKQRLHNTYNLPDDINQIDWDRKSKYKHVFNYVKQLIKLRKLHPAFRMQTVEEINQKIQFLNTFSPNVVSYLIKDNANNDKWKDILVIFNANREPKDINIPKGNWVIVLDGNSSECQVDSVGVSCDHQQINGPVYVQENIIKTPELSAMILVDKESFFDTES